MANVEPGDHVCRNLSSVMTGIVERASTAAPAQADPIAAVALLLVVILVVAKLGGDIATRIGQPAVLGELIGGMLLGNLGLVGVHALAPLATDGSIDMLARLGVLVLLFQVGLESTVGQMRKVGISSLLVAIVGVVVPFVLGWAASAWLLPSASSYVHAFLGATLCATSVGVTARVLQDLKASQTEEARIILGAAVIDDVLGLVVLAVVCAVIEGADTGTPLSVIQVALIFAKAIGFLVGALALGIYVSPRLFHLASLVKARGALLAMGLSFCFLLSWVASAIGLAAIVGAFAAGLILEDVHYRDFVDRGEHGLEELVAPISSFLVPVFFVLVGVRADLRALADIEVIGLAAGLTFAAIAGKQVCGLGAIGRGLNRITIGIGMVPRGEVGLIFANVGLGLVVAGERIVSSAVYSAIVVMVLVTTVLSPPALKWSLGRRAARPVTKDAI
jgi:Kef-type K+ transport system membrane component KefB